MKSLFSIIFISLVAISTALAQNSQELANPPFAIDAVTAPGQQTGNLNYLLSLSENDFKTGKFVFYTDSNATVAYLAINGVTLRLTGGPNPEKIMAYTGNGYSVTLSADKKSLLPVTNSDDNTILKISCTLAVYNNKGQIVLKKVTGTQANRVKN